MPVKPGQRVGRYEILGSLGVGGMGEVFRARDPRLNRDVAIKFLSPRLVAGAGDRRRFEREARAVAALRHPNVVTIHDIGDHEGAPYLVMEFVEGSTLRGALTRQISAAQIVDWGLQIAGALAEAHDRGIVHRDLKPENVIVGADGVLRVVDFGLAGFRRGGSGSDSQPTVTNLTPAAGLLGTPGYIPPEAAAGGSTDHRWDQFSLGVILYEMATGRRPFEGRSPTETLAATLRDEPVPIDTLRPQLPGALKRVIVRCLRKEALDRYATTRTLLEELRGEDDSQTTGTAFVGRIPAPRTPLIGRDGERDTIRRLVVAQKVRLITLSGPGGTGKTRLAMQVAEDLVTRFASRVYFIPLGAITEPELVVPAIARGLGLPGTRSTVEAIQVALSDTPSLFILDNFEQVMSAAPAVGALLAGCPALFLLVTSREVLRVSGEHDVPVEPLAFPRGESRPPLEELREMPAVALFVDRARAANPAFRLTNENAASVVEVCARLDGLPLSLELAAARMRALTTQSILSRLQSRLRLLTGGARDVPDRQRTLRATLDWSYELLDEAERTLFARLGVFVSGFGLEAAEAVADTYGTLGVDLVDGISSLVDKSLLRREDVPTGEPRFGMLETIREYALDRLADQGAVRKAHAAYYLVLAEASAAVPTEGEDAGWLATFMREHDNFRTALDWLIEHGEAEWGLRLALALFHYWDRAEHLSEGRRAMSLLLALPATTDHPPLHARALEAAGTLVSGQGEFRLGVSLHQQALDVWQRLGSLRGMAVSLNGLGVTTTSLRDYGKAAEHLERSLECWSQLGDDVGYARSLSNLAFVRKSQGDHSEASRLYERAAAVFTSRGDAVSAAWAINNRGDVAVARDDLDEASRLYEQALASFRSLGHRWGVASSLADLGTVAGRRMNWKQAAALYRESLQGFAALRHRRGIARLLETLALLEVEVGDPVKALTLAAAASALRGRIGIPASDEERAVLEEKIGVARAAAGERAGVLWAEGAAMPLDSVIRLAMEAQ